MSADAPIRVLVVEDNAGDVRLIRETLVNQPRTRFEVHTAERLSQALEQVRTEPFDVALLDLALPDSRGAATFEALHAAAPDLPTIVLTGLGDEELAPRLVRDGAQDYLLKGQAAGDVLPRAIRHAIERHRIRRDLTHAEEALRLLNDELEARVRSRTADLKDANRELEAFTYSVSHDLRAPLRHISGFARLLAEEARDQLDPRASHYLDQIIEGARHMGRLIDDLLQLARIGRQAPQVAFTRLGEIARAAIADLASEAGAREIEWQVADLPEVPCDPGLLRVVFTNLLSNAVKYTARRPCAVIEVGETTTRDGERVVFVRDNGVGFDMRYAHKLFGVFQRLHNAAEFEGTGVGLATVQRIIHRHGGRIWAEAEPDRGATFFFTLGTEERAAPQKRPPMPQKRPMH